jgi:hypothetical protein
MPNFSSQLAIQTGLDKFLTFFQENFRENSLTNFKKVPNLSNHFYFSISNAEFQLTTNLKKLQI